MWVLIPNQHWESQEWVISDCLNQFHPLLLIRWGDSKFKIAFFFCNKPIWLVHYSRKMKPWRLPKIEGPILMYRVPSLWPTYIGERRTTFAKAIWDKSEVLWKTCEAHIGNLGNILGTHCELKGNTLGTREKWKKSFFPLTAPKTL